MLYLHMFIRKLKNRSGSISIQIISKSAGKYKVIKTIGCGKSEQEIMKLLYLGKQEIERLSMQPKLFVSELDVVVEEIFSNINNAQIRTIGPELIFGKIYDFIGYGQINEDLFRHLTISRLSFPLSKLKTVDYLYRYLGISINIDSIYRFMDKLSGSLKKQVEQISFNHTQRILGQISVVFYDMTTLHFDAMDEDDLRKTGFSKVGKHQKPQIYLGLLVGLGGYAVGYDIFEGNTYEGHTLIPFLQKISNRFDLGKPIVVADSGLLTAENIENLKREKYEFIIGDRIKNESKKIKSQILEFKLTDGGIREIKKENGDRLLISYSENRAKKDAYNRKRGFKRLEKNVKTGKLTKSKINNRGYNKYLKLQGEMLIEIDYEKFQKDKEWDGLKGYITNSKLDKKKIIECYNNLWYIERAFRMSKTDLRIRPIYHRLEQRIEAHICISFVAYSIYKELERVLYKEKSKLSVARAAELTHNMYEITFTLPESKHTKSKLLKMNDEQTEIYQIVYKNF
jgi:transposase